MDPGLQMNQKGLPTVVRCLAFMSILNKKRKTNIYISMCIHTHELISKWGSAGVVERPLEREMRAETNMVGSDDPI